MTCAPLIMLPLHSQVHRPFRHCFALHIVVSPSSSANLLRASSTTALSLKPSFLARSLRSCLPSSLRRMLVGFVFLSMYYIVYYFVLRIKRFLPPLPQRRKDGGYLALLVVSSLNIARIANIPG